MSTHPVLVKAAGTLPFRLREGQLEVLLVHRPRYDDWSWPKGKLDEGEDWTTAAVRETLEETGLRVRLGVPLPSAFYEVAGRTQPNPKEVRYWAAVVTDDLAELENEVDAIAWVTPAEAHQRLTYDHDREPLRAMERLHHEDQLRTWPLLVVRHTKALPRREWHEHDALRPLNKRGEREASALTPVLWAYHPLRVVTSSSTRCVDTVAPFCQEHEVRCEARSELSEESFELDPSRALALMAVLTRSYASTVVCAHGPLLPPLLDEVTQHSRQRSEVRDTVHEAMEENMHKGEAFIVHLTYHDTPCAVAVERHRPDHPSHAAV